MPKWFIFEQKNRLMRKRDNAIKDITETQEIEAVINRTQVCHVGMCNGDKPYVLAFNFGYEDRTIYLHCAREGHKLDILRQNPAVCVYFDTDHGLFARHEHVACSWRWRYRSVMAHGKVEIVDDYEEKIRGLNAMMRTYAKNDFSYSKPSVDNIYVLKIEIESWSGRSFEY